MRRLPFIALPALVALTLTVIAPAARALPVGCTGTLACYTGMDHGPTDGSDPALASRANATAARTSFLGQLTNVRTQSFEGSDLGTGLGAVANGLTGGGNPLGASLGSAFGSDERNAITDVTSDNSTYLGRFNTSSAGAGRWADSDGGIGLQFVTPVSSFGFFATDVGDFAGTLDLVLTVSGSNDTLTLANIGPTLTPGENGGLLFFGVVDSARTFSTVRLVINQVPGTDAVDGVGFDDLSIGDLKSTAPNPAPEPGSLALAALGLLGAAATARRRRR